MRSALQLGYRRAYTVCVRYETSRTLARAGTGDDGDASSTLASDAVMTTSQKGRTSTWAERGDGFDLELETLRERRKSNRKHEIDVRQDSYVAPYITTVSREEHIQRE